MIVFAAFEDGGAAAVVIVSEGCVSVLVAVVIGVAAVDITVVAVVIYDNGQYPRLRKAIDIVENVSYPRRENRSLRSRHS